MTIVAFGAITFLGGKHLLNMQVKQTQGSN